MEIIKKCPFCGKEPQFYFNCGTFGYTPNMYTIKCQCGAEMKLIDNFCNLIDECKYKLIEKWNERKYGDENENSCM